MEGGPGSTFARLLLLNMHVKEESNLGMSTHKYSDSTLHKNGAILKNINREVKQSHWELSLKGCRCCVDLYVNDRWERTAFTAAVFYPRQKYWTVLLFENDISWEVRAIRF